MHLVKMWLFPFAEIIRPIFFLHIMHESPQGLKSQSEKNHSTATIKPEWQHPLLNQNRWLVNKLPQYLYKLGASLPENFRCIKYLYSVAGRLLSRKTLSNILYTGYIITGWNLYIPKLTVSLQNIMMLCNSGKYSPKGCSWIMGN